MQFMCYLLLNYAGLFHLGTSSLEVISNINKLLLSNKIGLYYSVACFSNKCHADFNNFKIGL